jgi:hypothetical protein
LKSLPFVILISLFLATGCATPEPAPAQPERLGQQVARATLERAEQAYDAGDYARTLTVLKNGEAVFDGAEPATRQAAMKLEAFSYCVANQLTECRAAFVRLLQVFPKFDLTVAERKHPVWGPAFETAKKMKR